MQRISGWTTHRNEGCYKGVPQQGENAIWYRALAIRKEENEGWNTVIKGEEPDSWTADASYAAHISRRDENNPW